MMTVYYVRVVKLKTYIKHIAPIADNLEKPCPTKQPQADIFIRFCELLSAIKSFINYICAVRLVSSRCASGS